MEQATLPRPKATPSTGSCHLHWHFHQLPWMKWNEISFIHSTCFIWSICKYCFVLSRVCFIPCLLSLQWLKMSFHSPMVDVSFNVSFELTPFSIATSFPYGNYFILYPILSQQLFMQYLIHTGCHATSSFPPPVLYSTRPIPAGFLWNSTGIGLESRRIRLKNHI